VRLEVGNILIKDIQFGDRTEVKEGVLFVNRDELAKVAGEDERIASVEVHLARPGEEIRIIPVKDVIEPRIKVSGKGGVFPGLVSKVDTVGEGRTHVLKGVAVVTTGRIVGFQEGVIDMTGPGAEYTPFSKTMNVVLKIEPVEGLHQHEHERVVRLAGLRAAEYLGRAGQDVEPDKIEVYETKPLLEQVKEYPDLPKGVYVYMLQTQGPLHNTYV